MKTEEYLPTLERSVNETSSQAIAASVIWLHGLGASGHDFEPVLPYLQLPANLAVRFVFPHAPAIAVTINGGYVMPAWYDILEAKLERKVDTAQIMRSSQRVAQLIDREIERGIASEKIILAGFSQGGAVAYQTALSYPNSLAGLMALSSYFASADDVVLAEANKRIPILVQHGTQDPVVDIELSQKAMQFLQENGYSPTYQNYPMGHEVCLEQIQDIGKWIAETLTK